MRADSGFCRENLMAFCEADGLEYVLGLARNSRQEQRLSKDLQVAHVGHLRTGKPATPSDPHLS